MSQNHSPYNNKKETVQKTDKVNNNNNELNPQIRNLNIINNLNNKVFPIFIGKKEIKEEKKNIMHSNQEENKEKNYSIQLNVIIKTKEKESKSELLEINLIELLNQKEPILIISMKDQNDPLFLFSLELKEKEYQQLKDEQSLLVDFQNFSDFVLKMLNFCKNDKNGIFSCILNIEDNLAVLAVEEKTQYRKFNHLILKFKEVNDINLKSHFNQILKEYKSKIEALSKQNSELIQNYQNSNEDYNILKNKYEKLEREQKTLINNLLNAKNKEINGIKENIIKETTTKLESLENEKNNIIHDLEKKISELQSSIDELTNNKSNLEKGKLELENSQQNLKQENISLKLEVNKFKSEISDLQKNNSELNQKNKNLEKEIIQLKIKNENSFKELKDKIKLIESFNKYKNLNEDTVKNLKLNNNKLENKLMISINEINKANDIIEKLQNEIKNQKNKLKNMKIEINNKETIISQKQSVLDEQNISIQNIKKDNEEKGKEIFSLTNKINNYIKILKDNEKVLEEDKQMILYLNKNISENSKNKRLNYISMFDTFSTKFVNDNYDSNNKDGNLKLDNKYISKGVNSMDISDKNNKWYTNDNNLNNINNEIKFKVNNESFDNKIKDVNYSQNENNLKNSISTNSSGIVFPETNFMCYQFRERNRKYIYKGTHFEDGNSRLLFHKYGNDRIIDTNLIELNEKNNSSNENNKI